jgi:aerobic-type carbon monoxide dehydrogenase small subunit (CoxS/CutS family)
MAEASQAGPDFIDARMIPLLVNGRTHSLHLEARITLLDAMRERLV